MQWCQNKFFSRIFKTVYLRHQGHLMHCVFLLTLENSSIPLMLMVPCGAPSVLESKLGSCWKATAAAVHWGQQKWVPQAGQLSFPPARNRGSINTSLSDCCQPWAVSLGCLQKRGGEAPLEEAELTPVAGGRPGTLCSWLKLHMLVWG